MNALSLAGRAGDHELRDGDRLVGTLRRAGSSGTDASVETTAGTWRFAGRGVLRPGVEVTDARAGERVATFRGSGMSGARGVIELGDRELEYRTEGALATRLVVADASGPLVEVAHDTNGAAPATVTLHGDVSDVLLMVACYLAVQNIGAAAASS